MGKLNPTIAKVVEGTCRALDAVVERFFDTSILYKYPERAIAICYHYWVTPEYLEKHGLLLAIGNELVAYERGRWTKRFPLSERHAKTLKCRYYPAVVLMHPDEISFLDLKWDNVVLGYLNRSRFVQYHTHPLALLQFRSKLRKQRALANELAQNEIPVEDQAVDQGAPTHPPLAGPPAPPRTATAQLPSLSQVLRPSGPAPVSPRVPVVRKGAPKPVLQMTFN